MIPLRKKQNTYKERNSVTIPFSYNKSSRRLLRKARRTEHIVELNKYAEIGKLSTGLIHDILNPLTSLLIGLEALNHSKEIAKPEMLKELQKASKRMREYAGLVQTYIKSEKISKSVCLNDTIQHGMELLAYKARSLNVSLIHIHKDRKIFIDTNPLWLHQIIINIISNAVESFAGVIRDKKQVVIKTWNTKTGYHISISDNGCGMSEEIQSHIFDPFYTTKREDSSCGIGLVSVKHLIENELSGSLSIESKLGKGTTFNIIIPT